MITEDQVVEAYRVALSLELARVQRDNLGRAETDAEQDALLEAQHRRATLEIQYLAQET